MKNVAFCGPLHRHIYWMLHEGFFSQHPDWDDTIFLTRIPDNLLDYMISAFDKMSDEPGIIPNEIKDVCVSILTVEGIRSGKLTNIVESTLDFSNTENEEPGFEFTEKQFDDWFIKYNVAVALEKNRREGLIQAKNLEGPFDDVLWVATEKGKEMARFLDMGNKEETNSDNKNEE